MRSPVTRVTLLALALLATTPHAAAAQSLDHFTCYKARPTAGTPRFAAVPGVSVIDRFRASTVDVRRPVLLCAPTNKNGEDPSAPGHPDHLLDYKVHPTTPFAPVATETLADQFGTHDVAVKKARALLVPAAKSLTAPPPAPAAPAVDHFQCYKAKRARGAPRFVPVPGVTLTDQFGTLTVTVKKVRRLCVPANKNGEAPGAETHAHHLLCYQIKETGQPRFARRSPVYVTDQFGGLTFDAQKPRELCVPAYRPGVPTPTTTPTVTPTPTATATPPLQLLAGAAKVNMTPFTLTPALVACRADPGCPYYAVLQLSDPAVSNPDGLPGGLFQTIGDEMAPGTASTDWVGPVGIWGESFVDANTNGRFDAGESFTDDAANNSALVGAGYPGPLGDAATSSQDWDGIYMAGYGNDRVALGAFDPIGARVLFVRDPNTGTSIAWVTLDLTGYFSDFVGRVRARLPVGLDVDHIILTHTHDHEAPDTVGLWGPPNALDLPTDGTYPRFEIYIEAKIAEAIAAAASALQPARFRFGSILPSETFLTPGGNLESMDGMISRNSCRTPWFFDDEVRVMQVTADPPAAGTIATFINWSAHVESMDARNTYVSSDFPSAARALVEQELGGVALYAPGAQGDAEIVGDSCTRRWNRSTFDGETHPVDAGGEPVAFQDPYDNAVVRDRSYAIGRVVGAAALAALAGESFDPPDAPFELIGPETFCFPVNNEGLVALAAAGTIDKPLTNTGCPVEAGAPPDRAKSALYALRIGSGSFLTAPGELFPELYYGVSVMHRAAAIGDYVSVNPDALDCAGRSHHGATQPGGHSDRPYEPTIRAAQVARFPAARVHFLIGYTPDLLGYIVPGYDYFWQGGPGGFGVPVDQIADPCRDFPPDLAFPLAKYGSHYQETNSAGSMLAPAVACELIRLLGDPLGEGGSAACAEWDTTVLTGRPPDEPLPPGYEPDCPANPEACLIRHY